MIGVIGLGVVGKAIYNGFAEHYGNMVGYDKYKADFQELDKIGQCSVVFVCVPTPTTNGVQDQTALEEVLGHLSKIQFSGIVVIKCTITPGTTEGMRKKYLLRLVHSPEFLTAKNPLQDFLNQKAVILGGGNYDDILPLAPLFQKINPYSLIQWYPSATISEMVKYMHNMYLTLKVSFCNEVSELCQSLSIPYTEVLKGTIAVGQMDAIHSKVPGPDGLLGFGGMCFPKDSAAYVAFAKHLGVTADTIEGAIKGNNRRRPAP